MNIFIVIPAFNEGKRIGKVLGKLVNMRLPVVVVDDGSTDNTFEIAKKFKVIAIRHRTNLGKGSALKTGIQAAIYLRADAIVMMDSDGQHKVEDLLKFINILESKKYDVIFGVRNLNLNAPLIRVMGNKLASSLIAVLFRVYVSDLICGYRAFTSKAYKQISWSSRGYGVETEMVIRTGKHGLKYCEVPIETVYYDKFKGVTILDAIGILANVIKWRITI